MYLEPASLTLSCGLQMIWMMILRACLANMWVSVVGVVADVLEGRARIQIDLEKLEKWCTINQMKFSEDKWEALHLDGIIACTNAGWGMHSCSLASQGRT